MRNWIGLVLLAVFISAACGAEKLPVPTPAELQQAEVFMHEVGREDFKKTKPEDKYALAQKLLKLAGDSKGHPEYQYVLLKEASVQAANAGEGEMALDAIEQWSEIFTADENPLIRTAMATAALNCKDPGKIRAYTARKILVDSPDDPSANQNFGEYLCFMRGDFEKAMPYLWKGTDTTYKTIAPRELIQPTEAPKQVELADAWWDMAEKERVDMRKQGMQARAVFWYSAALPNLTGLTKLKADKRMTDGAPAAKAMAGKVTRPPAAMSNYFVFKTPQSSLELTGSQSTLSQTFKQRTVECWFQIMGDTDGYIYKDGGGANQYSIGIVKGELAFGVWLGGRVKSLTVKAPPKGAWIHAAAQFDAGKMEFWINGQKTGELDLGIKDMPAHPGSSGIILSGDNIPDTGWGTNGFGGGILAMKISKGVKYTAPFKPGYPLTAEADTLALLDASQLPAGPITTAVPDQVVKNLTWTPKGELSVSGK